MGWNRIEGRGHKAFKKGGGKLVQGVGALKMGGGGLELSYELYLNIDECSDSSKNCLSDMKYIFSLTNFIKEPTCFKSQNSTLSDFILTNRPRSFMKS